MIFVFDMMSIYIYIPLYIYTYIYNLDDTEYPGGGSKYVLIRPDPWGNGIQFDEHIFQMG